MESPVARGNSLVQVMVNNKAVLKCTATGEIFGIKEGIACFQRTLDDYAHNYEQICADDLHEPKTPFIVKEKYAQLVRRRASGTTCDLGCGDGYVIRGINSPLRIAVDIAFEYLRRLPETMMKIWSRVEDVPLKPHIMDTVIATDVLEHVQEADAFAREIKRLVKPDGKIILAFPYEQDLSVYDNEQYKKKYGKYKYMHLRSVTDKLISELFPDYTVTFSRLITEGMKLMEFKPYPIKLMELRKNI